MVQVLKDNAKMYISWAIMIACISIGIVTTKLFSLVALAIFVIFAIQYSDCDSCVLLFGIMPFANIFKLSAGSTSFFTICELLVVAVSVLKNKKVHAKFVSLLLLFLTFVLARSFINFNLMVVIKVLVGFYLIHILAIRYNKKDVVNIAYLISFSTAIMLLLSMNEGYFSYVEPYLLDSNYLVDSSGHASDIVRASGFLGDPNYCGVLIVVSVALLCVLYYHKKIKWEFWVLVSILVPLGFFTYSKSYFLCISALIVFLIIFVLWPKHRSWAVFTIILVAVIVYMAMIGKFEVVNAILDRFTVGDLTSGRTGLNKVYMNYLWENPLILLFGEGIGADRIVGASNNVHNVYIESLFKLGIFGSILYLATLWASMSAHKGERIKRSIVDFLPMIFVLVMYSALGGITMYEFPFYISIAFLAVNFNSKEDSNPENSDIVSAEVENGK